MGTDRPSPRPDPIPLPRRGRARLLLAAGIVIAVVGVGCAAGPTSGGRAGSTDGPDLSLPVLAATAVPTELPPGAPAPPADHPTVYCNSNAVDRLAVDRARQARLLAQTFYIPKAHTAETPTTPADIADLRTDLAVAITKVYAGDAATFVTRQYSEALKPESGAAAGAATGTTATRDVSGGVSEWTCDSVTRRGSVLTVRATGSSWAMFAEVGAGGTLTRYAEPSNTEHLTYTFECDGGGVPLRITGFSSDYTV